MSARDTGGVAELQLYWQGADCAFGEIFGFDSKGMVKAGAIVFPCDCRGQFDQFGLAEFFPQAREERIGHFHWSPSHPVGVLEDEPLEFREVVIRAVILQIGDLPARDAAIPANGRADVDSKRTTNQCRNTQ